MSRDLVKPFRTGERWPDKRVHLNELVEATNAHPRIVGDGFIRSHQLPDGQTALSLDLDQIRAMLPTGGDGTEAWCLQHLDIDLDDDLVHDYTLDARDWRGRFLRIGGMAVQGCPRPGTIGAWDNVLRGDLTMALDDYAVNSDGVAIDYGVEHIARYFLNTAWGDALTVLLIIDGTDDGKLKLRVVLANNDRTQFWVWITATAQHDDAKPDITEPDDAV